MIIYVQKFEIRYVIEMPEKVVGQYDERLSMWELGKLLIRSAF